MSGEVVRLDVARERRARRETMANEEPLTKRELATKLGVSMKTIERWEKRGMPVAFRLWGGSGAPRYYLAACIEWHEAQG